MSVYLIFLGIILFYSLAALWPAVGALSITSVDPNQGPATAKTEVTILGTGFTDGTQVFFGDIPSIKVLRESDTVLLATTPPWPKEGQAGLLTVQVVSPSGQKNSLTNAFQFRRDTDIQQAPAAGSEPAIGPGAHRNTGETPTAPAASNTSAMREVQHKLAQSTTTVKSSSLPFFGWAGSLRDNIRLLLIVIIVGAVGGLIHVMRSFYWYVGNRNLKTSWLLMYLLVPFVAAGLALLFFLIIRGGFGQSVPTQSTVDAYAALAALVGMFSQQALAKLKNIAESVFTGAEKGKDQALGTAPLKLSQLKPTTGPTTGGTVVRMTGSGFDDHVQIKFGGVVGTSVTKVSDTQLTVTTPAHAAGAVDVEASNTTGQRSTLASVFTYVT